MIRTEAAGEKDGKQIFWYCFENKNGAKMTATNLGATIASIVMPDKEGGFADVTLGMDSIEGYLAAHPHMGSTAGRFANRIADGRFSLDGKEYQLARNNGKNHLHGGPEGFYHKVWDGRVEGDTLVLTYQSPAGEEGYPGNLTAEVRFALTDDNAVDIRYAATTDAATPLNLTNHTYFNLDGGQGTVLDHELTVFARQFTPTDEGLIPTGELWDVAGTPLDFTSARRIGKGVFEEGYEPIRIAGGYDHNFALDGEGFRRAAVLTSPKSGRRMEVWTDQPGVQVYTANFLPEGFQGRNGQEYGPFFGVCLETQAFPDSVNKQQFRGGVLRPGEAYTHHTRYAFMV